MVNAEKAKKKPTFFICYVMQIKINQNHQTLIDMNWHLKNEKDKLKFNM